MAWSTPANQITGDLITASIWNQNVVANAVALRTGGIAIASQATYDFISASSASQLARTAAVAGKAPRIEPRGTAWEMATLACQLLKASSGSTTSTGAENVDTLALASGLTAKDTLQIIITMEQVTQDMAGAITVHNVTDNVTVYPMYGAGTFPAAANASGVVLIRQTQSAATKILSQSAFFATPSVATFTTAWTGAWTIALRHTGVTAGGTFRWSWAIYRLVGQ